MTSPDENVIYFANEALMPLPIRRSGSWIVTHGGREYERVTESGYVYQRLIVKRANDWAAGPWRDLEGRLP